jgi:hypothetical protein
MPLWSLRVSSSRTSQSSTVASLEKVTSIQLLPLAVSNVGSESGSFSTTRFAAPTRSITCRPLPSSSSPPNEGCFALRSPPMTVGLPLLLARSASSFARVSPRDHFGGTYTLVNAMSPLSPSMITVLVLGPAN